jgi:hypothetical protein
VVWEKAKKCDFDYVFTPEVGEEIIRLHTPKYYADAN